MANLTTPVKRQIIASILKSFTGKTTRALIEAHTGARFKLVATATPAPNALAD